MEFSELELHPKVTEGLNQVGFKSCTPVQESCIPLILNGKDVAGLAQTGTGKTGAFLVPLIDRLLRSKDNDNFKNRAFVEYNPSNFILILVPTRELADQISANVETLGKAGGIKYVTIYGGTGYEKQKAMLKEGVDFVIATPGRLIDLYKENLVDLRLVRALVFDEADRMFDMGFKDDMQYILTRIPRDRQFLVFSATLNFDVLNTAYKFGAEPVEININRDQAKAENVTDSIIHIGDADKPAMLLSLIKKFNPKQTMVFSNFKNKVERIAQFLNDNGFAASAISSLQSQGQRTQVINHFKSNVHGTILVATDVAARGLDITGVDLVVNFELPDDPESYVHRIGRTGRAGETGTAVSLVSDRDVYALGRIEEFTKTKLESIWLEDAEIVKDFKPLAREQNRFYKPKPMTPFDSAGRNDRPKHGGPNNRNDRNDRGGNTRNPDARPQGPRGQGPRPQQGPHPGAGRRDDQRRQNYNSPNDQNRKQNLNGRSDNQPSHQNRQHAHQSKPQHMSAKPNSGGGRYRVVDKVPNASVTSKLTGFLKKLLGLKEEKSAVVSRGGHSSYKKHQGKSDASRSDANESQPQRRNRPRHMSRHPRKRD